MAPRSLLCILACSLLATCQGVQSPAGLKPPSYVDRLAMAAHIAARAQAGDAASAGFYDYAEALSSLLTHPPSVVQAAIVDSAVRLLDSGSDVPPTLEASGVAAVGQNRSISSLCVNHTLAIVAGIIERQPWAGYMLDAMGKPRPGLTQGNFLWPGAYQQCLDVRANTSVVAQPVFTGQYCRLKAAVGESNGTPVIADLGICTPDSCSDTDLSILVNAVLLTFNSSLAGKASVECAVEETTLDGRAIVAILICSVVLALLVTGTVLDLVFVQMPQWQYQKTVYALNNGENYMEENSPLLPKADAATPSPEQGAWMKALLAFSVYTNGSKLLSTQKSAGSLDCIHGVRFLSMTWVVFGHVFAYPLFLSANAGPFFQEVLKRWTYQALLNATVSVDSFFTISGLLVAYLTLKEMKKKSGKINWFMFYFHRFWRLTPLYMLVIMIYTCLSPYWGKGPFWGQFVSNPDRVNCETSWWTNLLYINNLVKADKLCLGQSWYLANDMQFYILSPLIIVPFYFSPLLGWVMSAIFLLITAIVPGVLTVQDHIPAGFLPNQLEGNGTQINMQDYFTLFYAKPYNRMGPYVIGMLAGYFLYRTDCKLRINKWLNLLGWGVATAAALAVLYGPYQSYNGHPLSLSVTALYNSTSRQVWAACLAWVVVACVTGNGGFVNTLLSWSALVPLSRLTYCIYLLHIMLLSIYLDNMDTVFYSSDLNYIMLFLAILVVSYMVSFVTSLAFEAPMMGLEKVLFGRGKRQEK